MQGREGSEALFLFADEAIVIVAEKGEIIRVNPAAEKLFRYDKEELVGKKIEVLVPTRYLKVHAGHREKYNQSPHPRSMGKELELFGMRKDKTEFPVEVSLSPYATSEGKFVIAFIIDITVRKLAEERLKGYAIDLEKQVKNRTLILEEAILELEQKKVELKEALEKEIELNELKSRFVSMASHEFRTPLATMLSSVTLVKKYGDLNDREKQEKHIERIKSSISNLTDILNDFLSLSKLEEGKIGNEPEEFDIEEFIEDIITEVSYLRKQEQSITSTHEGEKIVNLDKKLLKNIFFNLLSNAIKFSPDGGAIIIKSVKGQNTLTLTVQDSGIGIPAEDQDHLFERFFRGQNATYIQGTGLGLNIVAKYVDLMGGTIDFTSEENVGTKFVLNFFN